ncbi:YjaG family protein [Alteromonas sp. ASW11-130]|uniref:YjaG family protein n=1 Tax=Alteromonas sp. ASW11-130 TaxID=3015775 RepID=UPI00224288F9|nr:YjaG family protein [Alteromonas sp. ASW11-130]MCW8091943.1 YjaG family protein [Alteromonas sp. ASW11-130]
MTKKLNTFARVRELEGWKAVAFSAALLERMVPNYELFCAATDAEDSDVLRKCLNLVWEALLSPKSKINFALQLEKVEQATPDTTDYDSFGVYPAIDAAIGVAACLNLILKQDLQGAVVISKLSQGSVENYLLASGEADDETVRSHPLMEFEIEVQAQLLDYLDAATKQKEACQQVKQLALEEGISNLGIVIDDEEADS